LSFYLQILIEAGGMSQNLGELIPDLVAELEDVPGSGALLSGFRDIADSTIGKINEESRLKQLKSAESVSGLVGSGNSVLPPNEDFPVTLRFLCRAFYDLRTSPATRQLLLKAYDGLEPRLPEIGRTVQSECLVRFTNHLLGSSPDVFPMTPQITAQIHDLFHVLTTWPASLACIKSHFPQTFRSFLIPLRRTLLLTPLQELERWKRTQPGYLMYTGIEPLELSEVPAILSRLVEAASEVILPQGGTFDESLLKDTDEYDAIELSDVLKRAAMVLRDLYGPEEQVKAAEEMARKLDNLGGSHSDVREERSRLPSMANP
jgi:hypothetical protein